MILPFWHHHHHPSSKSIDYTNTFSISVSSSLKSGIFLLSKSSSIFSNPYFTLHYLSSSNHPFKQRGGTTVKKKQSMIIDESPKLSTILLSQIKTKRTNRIGSGSFDPPGHRSNSHDVILMKDYDEMIMYNLYKKKLNYRINNRKISFYLLFFEEVNN